MRLSNNSAAMVHGIEGVHTDHGGNYNVSIPLQADVGYCIVEIVIALLAIVGNSLVIVVFSKFTILQTVTNYYVISLASADLLVGLIGVPSAIATSLGLPANYYACLFMNSLLLLLCTASIFSLLAVTIDRFWAIIFPLTYYIRMTPRNAIISIVFIWVLSSVIGLLPLMGWNAGVPKQPRCFFLEVMDLKYLVVLYFVTILLPSVIMAALYWRIYRAVKKQIRRISMQNLSLNMTNEQPVLTKSETKAAQSIALVVILFIISWIPLYTFNTILYFCPGSSCHIPEVLLKIAILLSHFNSAWNPVIYAWGIRDYRDSLSKLVCKKSHRASKRAFPPLT